MKTFYQLFAQLLIVSSINPFTTIGGKAKRRERRANDRKYNRKVSYEQVYYDVKKGCY